MSDGIDTEDPMFAAHKPVEDGFPFVLETDSLADSMGSRLPNRSLYVVQGDVGSGKSLMGQRLSFGLAENNVKVLVITTELTTRGWIEQMESIGYGVTEFIRTRQLMVFSPLEQSLKHFQILVSNKYSTVKQFPRQILSLLILQVL